MSQFRMILSIIAMIATQGCTRETASNSDIDWNNINYVKIACDKGNATSPGCKYDEEAVDAGRRGGKGK